MSYDTDDFDFLFLNTSQWDILESGCKVEESIDVIDLLQKDIEHNPSVSAFNGALNQSINRPSDIFTQSCTNINEIVVPIAIAPNDTYETESRHNPPTISQIQSFLLSETDECLLLSDTPKASLEEVVCPQAFTNIASNTNTKSTNMNVNESFTNSNFTSIENINPEPVEIGKIRAVTKISVGGKSGDFRESVAIPEDQLGALTSGGKYIVYPSFQSRFYVDSPVDNITVAIACNEEKKSPPFNLEAMNCQGLNEAHAVNIGRSKEDDNPFVVTFKRSNEKEVAKSFEIKISAGNSSVNRIFPLTVGGKNCISTLEKRHKKENPQCLGPNKTIKKN